MGFQMRETFVTDLNALVRRGLVGSDRVGELKVPNGYRAVADDLFSLVNILRSSWDAIQGKTAISEEELTEAELLASRLIDTVGQRDEAPQTIAEAALRRQRAYTLLMNAYDDVRRVVIFVRWHEGDADEVAPSLYAGRSNGKRKQEGEAPAAGASQPSATSPAPATAAPTANTPTAPIGMPGSDPLAG